MESQSHFNCGRRAAQFHPALIIVSPLNALDQIDAKRNNASRKKYSFLEVKLRQCEENLDQDKYDIRD